MGDYKTAYEEDTYNEILSEAHPAYNTGNNRKDYQLLFYIEGSRFNIIIIILKWKG